MYYVYVDYRLDTGDPFYVGKGVLKRVEGLLQRNDLHDKIATKHGMSRHVIFETEDEELAFYWEISLIRDLETRNYNGGANFTDGGDGISGFIHSEESKLKISLSKMGTPAHNKGSSHTEEAKLKMQKAWETRSHIDDETRLKMSLSHKGQKHTPETLLKISVGNKGKKLKEETKILISKKLKSVSRPSFSEETKKKMSIARQGKVSPNKGKFASDETKKKRNQSLMGHKPSKETCLKMSHNKFFRKIIKQFIVDGWIPWWVNLDMQSNYQ